MALVCHKSVGVKRKRTTTPVKHFKHISLIILMQFANLEIIFSYLIHHLNCLYNVELNHKTQNKAND